MVAVILRAGGAEAVPFIDDQHRAAVFTGRLNDPLEGFCDQRSHLADHAAAAYAVAQFEEYRIFALRLDHQLVRDAFGRCGLTGADVAMKDDEGILLGNKIADRKPLAMMFLAPARELADVQQQTKLLVNPCVSRLKSKKGLFALGKRFAGKRRLAIENAGLAHDTQSFRCTP